ncbi:MAG: ribosome biogenesis GTPase YlqF [Tenericutes bacterium GWC2_34_14]|nr:MAG: ribosome biogenesis GTPase YlqF [Tenericutes bacterium GWA2_35_7]OHE28421.1 MAG: ribosome biogenesis GTPase YlqF [Tenericutes bacterium GWC2_34_14]OHE33671.1 MAG: ribosome biogenesis GTPase YlqF [Tenericutes bacterium GWE2_34_108]OHE36956.1 MAG: ribosome biogenesis GTPase YlqF [Tenericutes bacterium GWF1_35_14]OHE37964.1 MAG: ribosome biogenesis GTPase YlqF [Tenericutes bacterium GWF2_35_184]OHE43519.1 MAG: ribosome biogenesis GTPase YlqF [Tenericutes bacterium RIFOXYA2_FULL_36_32]OHE
MTHKQIQWFPGHMFKSLREIREKVKLMDLVFVLLDARLPYSSMNPELYKIISHKPMLLLFNKMDLADDQITHFFMKHYQEQGYYTLKIDAASGKNVQKIRGMAEEILKEKLDREKAKGLKPRALRCMILGIPNVGKSTLINQLSKSAATKTANTPGVTKSQQWIKLGNDFELLDTPGVLWPKFDDPKVGYHLAITGAIKDKILPEESVVQYTLGYLQQYYPDRLKQRYNIESDMDIEMMLETIGKQRGCLLKGGELDIARINQIVLTDLRNKQLGGLSFDRPQDVSI